MINVYAKKFCNEDLSLIENYDKAIADKDKTWHCHHRKEITTSKKQLLELGEYYNRPASELIFLTQKEHMALHKQGNKYMLGKHLSEEAKRKISLAHKDNKYRLGKRHSDETKQKLSEAMKGKTPWNKDKKCKVLTEETKQKISEANTGKKWFNNGIENVWTFECPEGFVRGRLKKIC